ncbi:MAG TPA: NACHT domain-containing protein, partial [Anaerolineae bacterium]|nr:NACHT domain-containing protein [Anaerolineae bacterium]
MPTSFDETTWRSRIAAWWRETARDPAGTMRRLGVRTAYGLLTASAWLPLLAAYADDPGPAVAALAGVLSGVGTNLLSNLVQGAYERATAPQRAEQEVAERPDLRAEYQQMLARLEVLAAAQDALGERWTDFEARLREELAWMGGQLRVETGGAAVVFGDVVADEFVGRDKTVITVRGERAVVIGGDAHGLIAVTGDGSRVYVSPDQVSPEALLAAYLRALARECQRLPLGVVAPRFLQTGPETPVPLPEVYVDLDVVAPVREERGKGERVFIARLARGEGGERVPLLEAVAHPEVTRFVLLGDPGSGKTTFVNYLAYTLAVGAQQAAPLQGMFPVRLVLREVAARCIQPGAAEGQARMLWDALRTDLAARLGEGGAERLFPYLQRRLLEEGGLILLDGLDEVPEAERRRKCLLEAVADLAGALPPDRSRVLVTARPYAYDRREWRLPGFEVLLLADFDEGQVERFVERWYQAVRPVMGWDEPTARGRGERLLAALEERPRLAALAARPLLLTLMATLHTSWGQLPEDRADLYEEMVKLLLSRWQRAREVKGPDGKPMVEPGIAQVLNVEESRVRSALHRLAFRVHERQGTGAERREEPADIGREEVLGIFASLLPEDLHPQVVLNYLETRAGLLVARAPGVYAFPHRSFQEYLAACHLADGPDFAEQLRERVLDDPAWWREVFLLGVGKARQGGLGSAIQVLNTLLPEGPEEVAERPDPQWRAAVLAGQALVDLHFPEVAEGKPHFEAVLKRVRRWLAALLETPEALAPRERAEAGDVLGKLGDPRPGVGTDPKTGLPDIIWVEIPPGPFLMGSAEDDREADDDEKPQHPVDIPYCYWMARYPVTVAQYGCFVEADGYEEPRWWTETGWAWRRGKWDSTVEEELLRDWLARRPADLRGRPMWWGEQQEYPNRPVVGVSWFEALAYCNWLRERLEVSGFGFQVWRDGQPETLNPKPETILVRLPTEAEWEKAARGAAGRRYPWGNEGWDPQRANIESDIHHPTPVGMYPLGATPSGLYDLAGNVWEW